MAILAVTYQKFISSNIPPCSHKQIFRFGGKINSNLSTRSLKFHDSLLVLKINFANLLYRSLSTKHKAIYDMEPDFFLTFFIVHSPGDISIGIVTFLLSRMKFLAKHVLILC